MCGVRPLQGTALLGLVVAILAGCEEMIEESKPEPAKPSAALYTEIDAAALLERWTVLPGGAVAEGANLSRRRLAATEGFRVLPFRFSEVRKYGSCVVFTTQFEMEWPDYETGKTEIITRTYHFVDCVGDAHEKNQVEGLFHAANMCDPQPDETFYVHILRAGHFDPDTHFHTIRDEGIDVDEPTWVHARIADHDDSFQWSKYITPTEEGEPVLVNWAVLGSGRIENDELVHEWGLGTAGFDTLHRRKELQFQIDHSIGVVKVEANDGAAFTEFQRRCRSLSEDSK